MASSPSLDCRPNPTLLQLPATLLTVILTYLPLPCKFSALTHVCHSLPRPTALTLQHDHLELSADCLSWLDAEPRNSALFGQLRSLTCLRGLRLPPYGLRGAGVGYHPPLGPQIARLFSPSALVSQPFCSLRLLYLSLLDDALTLLDRALLQSSVTPLPLLHTLCMTVVTRNQPSRAIDWLSRLPSLVDLTLGMLIDERAILSLFSLPLLSLDLHDCRVTPFTTLPADNSYSSAALETVSGTLRRLHLPSEYRSATLGRVPMGQLLMLYAERSEQHADEVQRVDAEKEKEKEETAEQSTALSGIAAAAKWRLEHLRYGAWPPEQVECVIGISSLTSLHISCFYDINSLNAFFLTASPVDLPHLSRIIVPVTDIQSRRRDETAVNELCLAFFPSFAQQLQYVTLIALSPSARYYQRLLVSVLTCVRLVSLKLSSDLAAGQPIVLPARIEPMLLLKKLHIRSPAHRSERASHLQHADVVRLLESCPALHDLSLSLPNASINLLPAIARACPQLRVLTIRSDDVKLWDMSEATAVALTRLSTAAFTSLHTLHIDYDLKAGQSAPQPTAALLSSLSALLCRAPILRLCLLPHMDVTSLPFYASFPQLVRLRLHDPQLRNILQHYCTPLDMPSQTSQSEPDRRLDSWRDRTRGERRPREGEEEEEAVDSWSGWEEEWRSCPAFVGERLFVGEAGRALTGREAWLERAKVVAAAETERRRRAALEKARLAAEEESRQQKRGARKSKRKKAPEASSAEAFFVASGIVRKKREYTL